MTIKSKKNYGAALRAIVWGVVFMFTLTSVTWTMPSAYANTVSSVRPDPVTPFKDLMDISLPAEIGKIREIYRGASDKTVILIQDAHSVPDAQRSIQSAIDLFQKEYGVTLVGLEGASERLDPQIFRSFPDQGLLRKTFDDYSEKGELTGGTAAALFSAGGGSASGGNTTIFQGIEDWELYEKGIANFLEAMKTEGEVTALLQQRIIDLEREKEAIYPGDLLKVDRLLAQFGENKTDLAQVLSGLSQYLLPPEGSELAVLLGEIQINQKQEARDKRQETTEQSLSIEVKKIAEQMESVLKSRSASPELEHELQAFYGKRQEYQTSQLTPQAFALFLKDLAKQQNVKIKVSRELASLVEDQKKLRDIEGTRLFEDFERYTKAVTEKMIGDSELATRDSIRQLNVRTQELALLGRLAKLELSFEDWTILKKTMVKPWTPDPELRTKLEPHLRFYRIAEQRDEVFYKNLNDLMKKNEPRTANTAILVAGGFHTGGLTQTFKEKGISYILVVPQIDRLPEQSLYREHMEGDVSWKNYFEVKNGKVNLYDAFVRATRDKLLHTNGLTNLESRVPSSVRKQWRDQIIRDLAEQGRIAEASGYTRFIDELSPDSGLQTPNLKEKWLANIEHFGNGLKKLQAAGKLSESGIAQLLKSITTAEPVLASVLVPGAEIRWPLSVPRSEVRATDAERLIEKIQEELRALRDPQEKIEVLSPLTLSEQELLLRYVLGNVKKEEEWMLRVFISHATELFGSIEDPELLVPGAQHPVRAVRSWATESLEALAEKNDDEIKQNLLKYLPQLLRVRKKEGDWENQKRLDHVLVYLGQKGAALKSVLADIRGNDPVSRQLVRILRWTEFVPALIQLDRERARDLVGSNGDILSLIALILAGHPDEEQHVLDQYCRGKARLADLRKFRKWALEARPGKVAVIEAERLGREQFLQLIKSLPDFEFEVTLTTSFWAGKQRYFVMCGDGGTVGGFPWMTLQNAVALHNHPPDANRPQDIVSSGDKNMIQNNFINRSVLPRLFAIQRDITTSRSLEMAEYGLKKGAKKRTAEIKGVYRGEQDIDRILEEVFQLSQISGRSEMRKTRSEARDNRLQGSSRRYFLGLCLKSFAFASVAGLPSVVLAQSSERTIFAARDWKIIGATDSGPGARPIRTPHGTFTEIKIVYKGDQIFSVKGNGYLRGVLPANYRGPNEERVDWGTSFVLPGYWSEGVYSHNPRITQAKFKSGKDGTVVLSGVMEDKKEAFQSKDFKMIFRKPLKESVEAEVSFTLKARRNFSIDADRAANHEGFKVLQFSSMNIGTAHDADFAIYQGENKAMVRSPTAGKNRFIVPQPQPLEHGLVYLTNEKPSSWGYRPTVFIQMLPDSTPSDFSAQGWIAESSNPNDDNLGAWIHFDRTKKTPYKKGNTIVRVHAVLGTTRPGLPLVAPASRSEARSSAGVPETEMMERFALLMDPAERARREIEEVIFSIGPGDGKFEAEITRDPHRAVVAADTYGVEYRDYHERFFRNDLTIQREAVFRPNLVLLNKDFQELLKAVPDRTLDALVLLHSDPEPLARFLADKGPIDKLKDGGKIYIKPYALRMYAEDTVALLEKNYKKQSGSRLFSVSVEGDYSSATPFYIFTKGAEGAAAVDVPDSNVTDGLFNLILGSDLLSGLSPETRGVLEGMVSFFPNLESSQQTSQELVRVLKWGDLHGVALQQEIGAVLARAMAEKIRGRTVKSHIVPGRSSSQRRSEARVAAFKTSQGLFIEEYGDTRRAVEQYARLMADTILDNNRYDRDTTYILPTGSTPIELYDAFIRIVASERIDLSRLHTFNMDEYYPGAAMKKLVPAIAVKQAGFLSSAVSTVVGSLMKRFVPTAKGPVWAEDIHSFRAFMEDKLFKHLRKFGFKDANIHFLNGNAEDFEAECRRYENSFPGRIDLGFGGIGRDGHIAFNEPIIIIGNDLIRKKLSGDQVREWEKKFADFNEFLLEQDVDFDQAVTMALANHFHIRTSNEFREELQGTLKASMKKDSWGPEDLGDLDGLIRGLLGQKVIFYVDEITNERKEQLAEIKAQVERSLGRPVQVVLSQEKPSAMRTRRVELAVPTIIDNMRDFSRIKEMPLQALTIGPETFRRAAKIAVLAFGENKADAVKKATQEPASSEVSASFLQGHPDATFAMDVKAGALLTRPRSEIREDHTPEGLRLLDEGFLRFTPDSLPDFNRRLNILEKNPINGLGINPLNGHMVSSYLWKHPLAQQHPFEMMPIRVIEAELYEKIDAHESNLLWFDERYIPIAGDGIYHPNGSVLSEQELKFAGLKKVFNASGEPVRVKMLVTGNRVFALPGPWVVPYVEEGIGIRILSTFDEISELAGEKVTRNNAGMILKRLAGQGKVRLKVAATIEFKGVGAASFLTSVVTPDALAGLDRKMVYIPGADYKKVTGTASRVGGGVGATGREASFAKGMDAMLRREGAQLLADTVYSSRLFNALTLPELIATKWQQTWYSVRMSFDTNRLAGLVSESYGPLPVWADHDLMEASYQELFQKESREGLDDIVLRYLMENMASNLRALWVTKRNRTRSSNITDNYGPLMQMIDTSVDSVKSFDGEEGARQLFADWRDYPNRFFQAMVHKIANLPVPVSGSLSYAVRRPYFGEAYLRLLLRDPGLVADAERAFAEADRTGSAGIGESEFMALTEEFLKKAFPPATNLQETENRRSDPPSQSEGRIRPDSPNRAEVRDVTVSQPGPGVVRLTSTGKELLTPHADGGYHVDDFVGEASKTRTVMYQGATAKEFLKRTNVFEHETQVVVPAGAEAIVTTEGESFKLSEPGVIGMSHHTTASVAVTRGDIVVITLDKSPAWYEWREEDSGKNVTGKAWEKGGVVVYRHRDRKNWYDLKNGVEGEMGWITDSTTQRFPRSRFPPIVGVSRVEYPEHSGVFSFHDLRTAENLHEHPILNGNWELVETYVVTRGAAALVYFIKDPTGHYRPEILYLRPGDAAFVQPGTIHDLLAIEAPYEHVVFFTPSVHQYGYGTFKRLVEDQEVGMDRAALVKEAMARLRSEIRSSDAVDPEFRAKVMEPIGEKLAERRNGQDYQILILVGASGNGKTEIAKLLQSQGVGEYGPEDIAFMETDDYLGSWSHETPFKLDFFKDDLDALLTQGKRLVIISGVYTPNFLTGYEDHIVDVLLDSPVEQSRLRALVRDGGIAPHKETYRMFKDAPRSIYDLVLTDIPSFSPPLKRSATGSSFSFVSPEIYGKRLGEQSYRVSVRDMDRIIDLIYRESERSGLVTWIDPLSNVLSDVEQLVRGVERTLESMRDKGNTSVIMTVRSFEKGLEVILDGQQDDGTRPRWGDSLSFMVDYIPERFFARKGWWVARTIDKPWEGTSPKPEGGVLAAFGFPSARIDQPRFKNSYSVFTSSAGQRSESREEKPVVGSLSERELQDKIAEIETLNLPGRYAPIIQWIKGEGNLYLPASELTEQTAIVDLGTSTGYGALDLHEAFPAPYIYAVDPKEPSGVAITLHPSDKIVLKKADQRLLGFDFADKGGRPLRVKVIILFNVMQFYRPDEVADIVRQSTEKLDEGGLYILGVRYPTGRTKEFPVLKLMILQKVNGAMVPRELILRQFTDNKSTNLADWVRFMSDDSARVFGPRLATIDRKINAVRTAMLPLEAATLLVQGSTPQIEHRIFQTQQQTLLEEGVQFRPFNFPSDLFGDGSQNESVPIAIPFDQPALRGGSLPFAGRSEMRDAGGQLRSANRISLPVRVVLPGAWKMMAPDLMVVDRLFFVYMTLLQRIAADRDLRETVLNFGDPIKADNSRERNIVHLFRTGRNGGNVAAFWHAKDAGASNLETGAQGLSILFYRLGKLLLEKLPHKEAERLKNGLARWTQRREPSTPDDLLSRFIGTTAVQVSDDTVRQPELEWVLRHERAHWALRVKANPADRETLKKGYVAFLRSANGPKVLREFFLKNKSSYDDQVAEDIERVKIGREDQVKFADEFWAQLAYPEEVFHESSPLVQVIEDLRRIDPVFEEAAVLLERLVRYEGDVKAGEDLRAIVADFGLHQMYPEAGLDAARSEMRDEALIKKIEAIQVTGNNQALYNFVFTGSLIPQRYGLFPGADITVHFFEIYKNGTRSVGWMALAPFPGTPFGEGWQGHRLILTDMHIEDHVDRGQGIRTGFLKSLDPGTSLWFLPLTNSTALVEMSRMAVEQLKKLPQADTLLEEFESLLDGLPEGMDLDDEEDLFVDILPLLYRYQETMEQNDGLTSLAELFKKTFLAKVAEKAGFSIKKVWMEKGYDASVEDDTFQLSVEAQKKEAKYEQVFPGAKKGIGVAEEQVQPSMSFERFSRASRIREKVNLIKSGITEGDPYSVLYFGAGIDLPNVLVTTGADEVVMVDSKGVMKEDVERVDRWFKGDFSKETAIHSVADLAEQSADLVRTKATRGFTREDELYGVSLPLSLWAALRSMGVDRMSWGTNENGILFIEFEKPFPAGKNRNVRFYFVRSGNLTEPGMFQSTGNPQLTKIMGREFDAYFQNGGQSLGHFYDHFIDQVRVKENGFWIVDDHYWPDADFRYHPRKKELVKVLQEFGFNVRDALEGDAELTEALRQTGYGEVNVILQNLGGQSLAPAVPGVRSEARVSSRKVEIPDSNHGINEETFYLRPGAGNVIHISVRGKDGMQFRIERGIDQKYVVLEFNPAGRQIGRTLVSGKTVYVGEPSQEDEFKDIHARPYSRGLEQIDFWIKGEGTTIKIVNAGTDVLDISGSFSLDREMGQITSEEEQRSEMRGLAEIDRLSLNQYEIAKRLMQIEEKLKETLNFATEESDAELGNAVAYATLLSMLKKYAGPLSSKRMLEIGSREGYFLMALRELGMSCDGLEIAPKMVSFGKREGLSVFLGSILDLPRSLPGKYDVTFSRQVLDVLDDVTFDGQFREYDETDLVPGIKQARHRELGRRMLANLAALTNSGGISIHEVLDTLDFPVTKEDYENAGFEVLDEVSDEPHKAKIVILRRVSAAATGIRSEMRAAAINAANGTQSTIRELYQSSEPESRISTGFHYETFVLKAADGQKVPVSARILPIEEAPYFYEGLPHEFSREKKQVDDGIAILEAALKDGEGTVEGHFIFSVKQSGEEVFLEIGNVLAQDDNQRTSGVARNLKYVGTRLIQLAVLLSQSDARTRGAIRFASRKQDPDAERFYDALRPYGLNKEPGENSIYWSLKAEDAAKFVRSVDGRVRSQAGEEGILRHFRQVLPVAVPQEKRSETRSGTTEMLKGRVILHVDDDPADRANIQSSLERAGAEVLSVADGKTALEILGKRDVDAVVTDAHMPEMSGAELIRKVQAIKPEISIVMATREDIDNRNDLAHQLGIAVVRKNQVVETLSKLFKPVVPGRSEVRAQKVQLVPLVVEKLANVLEPSRKGVVLDTSEVLAVYELARKDLPALIQVLKTAAEEQMAQRSVQAGKLYDRIKEYQEEIFRKWAARPADSKEAGISVALMMDEKTNQPFLSRFAQVLKTYAGRRKVELIADSALLNTPELRASAGLYREHPLDPKSVKGTLTVLGSNAQVPLGFDAAAEKAAISMVDFGFRPLSVAFKAGNTPDDVLMRDHLELLLAVTLLHMAELIAERKKEDGPVTAAWLKTQLEAFFGIGGMFQANADGSLSILGAVVQQYLAQSAVGKAA
ncbi:MAG: response regulator [Candidatus Omnitrophota bacterium]